MTNKALLWRLVRLAVPFWSWMALAALAGFLTVGSGIVLMGTSAWIIARAALHPSITVLHVAIATVRLTGITRAIFRYLERYISHEVNFRLLARLRVWFYERLEPLAPARLMAYRSADLLTRIISDIETLEHLYIRVLAPPLILLLTLLTMMIFTGAFDLLLMLPLIFLLLAGVGVPLLTGYLSHRPGREWIATRAALQHTLLDGVQGMPDLIVYGRAEAQRHQVRHLGTALNRQQQQMARITGLEAALNSLMVSGAVIILLILAIPRVEALYLAPLTLAVMASFEAALPMAVAFQFFSATLAAARRLFEIVDAEPVIVDPAEPLPAPATCDLTIENLTFRYNPQAPPALENFSLHLPGGGCVAIVGSSGAGKSTLLNLLLRFYDYEKGVIRLGGHDLRRYRAEDVRGCMGVVTQNTHLFNATLRENLLLARPGASPEALIQAAQQARLHDFIQALPQGYDTWIGEQGMRLSGGERQRLALARALLKKPSLLLLDEATANLDTLTENRIMQTLFDLRNKHTLLIITHRLVRLEAMDQILVLEGGHIVQQGRHSELAVQAGPYQRLLMFQNQKLKDETAIL